MVNVAGNVNTWRESFVEDLAHDKRRMILKLLLQRADSKPRPPERTSAKHKPHMMQRLKLLSGLSYSRKWSETIDLDLLRCLQTHAHAHPMQRLPHQLGHCSELGGIRTNACTPSCGTVLMWVHVLLMYILQTERSSTRQRITRPRSGPDRLTANSCNNVSSLSHRMNTCANKTLIRLPPVANHTQTAWPEARSVTSTWAKAKTWNCIRGLANIVLANNCNCCMFACQSQACSTSDCTDKCKSFTKTALRDLLQ